MALLNDQKSELISDYRRSESDTGSPEVQVAILSKRIEGLTEHLKTLTPLMRPVRMALDLKSPIALSSV